MDKATALARLRAHEAELRALGITRLSLFGSVARDEARAESDVDLAATLDPAARMDLFRLAALEQMLEKMLVHRVDLLTEPTRQPYMRDEIERDRVHVF